MFSTSMFASIALSLPLLFLSSFTSASPIDQRALPTPSLVYQYAPGTWVENLAVRPNGNVVVVTTTSAKLNEIDAKTGSLKLIHDFSSAGNAIQGIEEVKPDLFVIDVETCDFLATLSCTQGSVSTWRVDLRNHHHGNNEGVKVDKVASFPTAGFLNGMATLDAEKGIVLLADSFLGGVWSVNIYTGANKLLFTDLSMNGTATIPTGINGIRVRGSTLYFTNSAKGTFNSIPIDPTTGLRTGNVKVLASGLSAPDDFEINDHGSALVAEGGANRVQSICLDGSCGAIVADFPGPTSVRWKGDDRTTAYVSTTGGLEEYVNHDITVGGAVYKIAV